MNNFKQNKKELEEKGYSITKTFFNDNELTNVIGLIENNNPDFSERQLLNKIPQLQKIIFQNKSFRKLFDFLCQKNYFLSKSIYFNKPSKSNWFVSYHQDLSISVIEKIEDDKFSNWTNKKGQLGVIPPLNILENTITFRIHLDKTNSTNGCLKVIPNTHKRGIIRVDKEFNKDNEEKEFYCNVEKGALMLMKPLLLHSSQKSVSENDRRVIHLEFCNQEIPMGWLEKKVIS